MSSFVQLTACQPGLGCQVHLACLVPGFATSDISGLSLFQARQKWHITADKGFASSSNARNELMLRDAGEFAGHIKRCEKDIRILKNATEGTQLDKQIAYSSSPSTLCVCVSYFWHCTAGLINTTKAVMSAPLPKVYEDCGNGTAQPIATTQGLSGAIGGEFKVDELQRVSKETASSAIYAATLNILLMTLHLPFVTRTSYSKCDNAGKEAGGRGVGTYAKMDHSIQHSPGAYEQAGGCPPRG